MQETRNCCFLLPTAALASENGHLTGYAGVSVETVQSHGLLFHTLSIPKHSLLARSQSIEVEHKQELTVDSSPPNRKLRKIHQPFFSKRPDLGRICHQGTPLGQDGSSGAKNMSFSTEKQGHYLGVGETPCQPPHDRFGENWFVSLPAAGQE